MDNSQSEEKVASLMVEVAGVKLDLSTIPALTLGNKRKLYKEYGVIFDDLQHLDPDKEVKLVLFMVRLLRPETTEAEVEDMEIQATEKVLRAMVSTLRSYRGNADRPISKPSPVSPGGGDGGHTI